MVKMKDTVNRVIGVEISANMIRAAEVSGSSLKPRIEAVGEIELPQGAVSAGQVLMPETFMKQFKKLVSNGGFKSKNVVIALNNQNVIMRIAAFPKVDEDKQRNVILLQAQDFIPIPLTELELSYVLCGESEGENGVDVNAMLVAARSTVINSIVDAFQNPRYGGFAVRDITLGVTAFADQIAVGNPPAVYMLIHANSEVMNILIIKNGNIAMARSVQYDSGVTDEYNQSILNGNITEEIVSYTVESIKNEYWSSLNYFKIRNTEEINKLYIYTQSVNIEERTKELAEDLAVYTELIDITGRIKVSGENTKMYNGCVAAALTQLK